MNNWQRRLSAYTWLAVVVIVVAQLLAPMWWVAELFSHFTLHGAVFVFLSAMWIRSRFRFVLLLFSLAIITWSVLPLAYWATPKPLASATKILLYNVAINNTQLREEVHAIKQTDADLLLLIEAGGQWRQHLQTLSSRYPYGCGRDDESPFAMKVLAKTALKGCQLNWSNGFPYIRIETQQNAVVYVLHPPPPINADLATQRKNYLLELAAFIQQESYPVLVAGDLNNTAFSPLHRRFLQQAALQTHTYHALPTWKPFFLPIDHVMSRATPNQSVQVSPLSWQFSDHRPLLISWHLDVK